MGNYNQAPELRFNGAKGGGQFYMIPQELADIIFKELGNASAQLRIMLVLLGTKEGFRISDKWICDRTGLQHPSYITARKALVSRGWLTHDAAKGITVNLDAIYNRGNMVLPDETKKSCSNTVLPQGSNMVLPHSSNMVLPQRSNMVLPITNKEKLIPVGEKYEKTTKEFLERNKCAYEPVAANLVKILATGKVVEVI